MLAALSMADEELVDRFLDLVFNHQNKDSGDAMGEARSSLDETQNKKIRDTIKSCQALLETERPERMDGYWGSVRRPPINNDTLF